MNSLTIRLEKDSLFEKSQQIGLSYVLSYNPDRFLSSAYTALGKTPKAQTYGGWENRQIQGHMLGHYLSALSAFVQQTGNREAKEKLDYTVQCIKTIQRADGYFGGIPSTPFDEAFSGDFEVERFSLAHWWVPWYSLHKIFAGLLDAYTAGKNQDALAVVQKMANWAIAGTSKMSDTQMQKMLVCEHGGMCTVFADLYGITGQKKYLSEAERWIHHEIIDNAMQKIDALQGYHANTQIPKFIGIARLYELTGNKAYRTAAEFFFDTVTKKRSYVIGGNSKGEHFGRAGEEPLARDTAETCNTYNMLALAEHIFDWNKKSDVADFYENALYNHILASQAPDTGAKTYFVSLLPGFFKVYCTHDNAMWCCTGTGLENPARYNRFVAKIAENTIFINLFIASQITTEDGWKLKIETDFPYSPSVRIKVLQAGKNGKTLKIRAPHWCTTLEADKDGYADFGALSASSDIHLCLDMKLHVQKSRDSSEGHDKFSIKYGPIVLAADLGSENLPNDTVDDHLLYMQERAVSVAPIKENLGDVSSWIRIKDAQNLLFETADFVLKPFFATHHTRYTVYFSSTEHKNEMQNSGDFVEVGRQQSEIEHDGKSENTTIGYDNATDRNFRAFGAQSFIEYTMDFTTAKKIVLTAFKNDIGSFSLCIDNAAEYIVPLSSSGASGTIDLETDVPGEIMGKHRLKISGTVAIRLSEIKLIQ